MGIYLTKSIDGTNENIGVVGTLTDNGGSGWTFISRTQRGNGRVLRDSAEAAVPKWFKGYFVDAKTTQEAIELTRGYREGVQWANTDALNGLIKIIS